jgi:catechol 2,3-dioxygenase-like lactoylglutathione lyase family enzyme
MTHRMNHPSSALIRATIFVRDLDKATAFYRAIGLTETYFEGDLAHPSATAILGFDDPRPFQIRIVKRPGPNFGMVGLFKLAEGTTDEVIAPARGPARIGEVALVFYVTDIKATMRQLRDLGATWAPEPQVFAMGHRAQLEVCLRDCDGVFVNLVETDPAQQERTRPELDYTAN